MAKQRFLSARLMQGLDVQKLRRDLETVTQFPTKAPISKFVKTELPGWSLYSMSGSVDDVNSNLGTTDYIETPALKAAPYFKEILDGLDCPKMSCRILAMPPGGQISIHRDPLISFRMGKLRLHIPITTHPDLEFVIAGERQRWLPGELWYGEFTEFHSVDNPSPIVRNHLVLDVGVTEGLLKLFPKEIADLRRSEGIAIHQPKRMLSDAELAEFACAFIAPPKCYYLNSSGNPLPGSLRPIGQTLQLSVGGEHVRTLTPLGDDWFSVVGAPPGMRFRFERENGMPARMFYNVKGATRGVAEGQTFEIFDQEWSLEMFSAVRKAA